MTQADLVERVSGRTLIHRQRTKSLIDALFSRMGLALKRGERVELRGLGSFRVRTRPRDNYVHPCTGERREVPAAKLPSLTPTNALRKLVNGQPDHPVFLPRAIFDDSASRRRVGDTKDERVVSCQLAGWLRILGLT